jgi:hypothetical protein
MKPLLLGPSLTTLLVLAGACGGSGGTTGLAGSGGTTGLAGSGGTTGVAGSGGTTGLAGSGGRTGLAGSGGATGSAGSGGTTGLAGSGGTTGLAGTGGATGSAGSGGVTGRAGSGGAAGATGGTGAGGAAAGMVCTSSDPRCTNAVWCGNACCRPGEWCDETTNLPHCRCGTTGAACAAPDVCGAPSSACGGACCGSTVTCPKSRRSEKRDIEAVSDVDRLRLYGELRAIELRTYRYRDAPRSSPRRLGFIIDDTLAPEAINPDGNTVDLYGYLSMAVAALQTQAKEIEELRARIKKLETRPGRR